jgi:hypothetical protein
MIAMPSINLLLLLSVLAPAADAGSNVEFNRDVRPILSDVCFACHGPDKAKRKGGLRLDLESSAKRVVTPGKPDKSEIFRRISSTDVNERMPPEKHPVKLTTRQIDLVKRWIEQGAKWQAHWALIPPARPELPKVTKTEWVRNPIDSFVLARLERQKLSPSPEADRTTLLRRVTLDLTGLPPTLQEVDDFLADKRPDAYERVVDRLLASPRYGERMAIRWMNAARYADTSGYQSDGERVMWRWRDYVIDAYNRNLPFDQFTIEQLAGDLLPHATLEQNIATGFNRNHRGNGEGGIIPEEYQVEYVVDRVETTSAVWLGLTLGCARCHDHKYDPFSQKEFYQFFAYFNNIPELGRAIKIGNSPPYIVSPTREQQAQLAALDVRLGKAESDWREHGEALAVAQRKWEKRAPTGQWYPSRGLNFHLPGEGTLPKGVHSVSGTPEVTDGAGGKAWQFDGKCYLDAGNVGNFGFFDKFTLSAWIRPSTEGGTILGRGADVEQGEGYALRLVKGKLQLNLVKRWLDDALRVETEMTLTPDHWHHVAVSYDGSRAAGGVRFSIDGQPVKQRVLLDELNQTFASKEPLRIGAGQGGRFVGGVGDVRVYNRVLSAEEALILATTADLAVSAGTPREKRSAGQAAKLRACFLDQAAPEKIKSVEHQRQELHEERDRLIESFPTTMVMEEMPTPRETHVLIRGVYDKPGEKVTPGVPAVFPPLPAEGKNDRLKLARWIASPENPLTARVAVNRYWQMYFGEGLVRTPEDFGVQGEPSSHPELLDWLATEFVRLRWDVKAMQKLIVTSATYRQSSQGNRDLYKTDPNNRLLARGPRHRLSAEMVRDQALFASGLLVEKVGGPSVKPYQPKGIEKELGADPYVQDHGDKLYRRSLYTFWKRTVAPPLLTTFDAPGREACMVRETRTNTPLQALNLLNDVTFVEAARVLAERVLKEKSKTDDERLTLVFRLVVSRKPKDGELEVLRGALAHHREVYAADRKKALKLLQVGEAPRDETLDAVEVAALANVVSVIFNLDEALNKE